MILLYGAPLVLPDGSYDALILWADVAHLRAIAGSATLQMPAAS